MAKNKQELSKKELLDQINGVMASMDARSLQGVLRFVEAKRRSPGLTSHFTASDRFGMTMLYKILAFDSIRSTAAFNLGTKINPQEFIELMSKFDEVNDTMEKTIDYAYEKGIGRAWEIERYKKEKAKAEEKASGEAESGKEAAGA